MTFALLQYTWLVLSDGKTCSTSPELTLVCLRSLEPFDWIDCSYERAVGSNTTMLKVFIHCVTAVTAVVTTPKLFSRTLTNGPPRSVYVVFTALVIIS